MPARIVLACLFAYSLSCTNGKPPPSLQPIEPGRWRLDPSAVSDLALNVEHILVTHEGSRRAGTTLPRSLVRATKRTREQALGRAVKAAQELARAADFAGVARRFSDDMNSAPLGGAIGHVRAADLNETYLDALFDRPPGVASRIFETKQGFHIARKVELAEEVVIPARAVVVAYQGTYGIYRRGHNRTFDAALAIAREAHRSNQPFPKTAELLSDLDGHSDGNIGPLSRTRSAALAQVSEALFRLQPGERSGPIDTPLGLYVVERPRDGRLGKRLASTQVIVRDEPGVNERALMAKFKSDLPWGTAKLADALFSNCPRSTCKLRREQWHSGFEHESVEELISKTDLGTVAGPIRTELGWRLIRPEVPQDQPDPYWNVKTEKPELHFQTAEQLIARLEAEQLSYYVGKLGVATAMQFARSETEQASLADAFTAAAAELSGLDDASRRTESVAHLRGRVREILGAERSQMFGAFERQWLHRAQLYSADR